MSRIDAWMPLYIGDYLADTRRLTTTEHGAYLLLLMEQWRRGWLPDDDEQLARITGLRLDHWRKASGNLRPYFEAGDLPGTMRQKRLNAERDKAMGISAKRADAARAKAAASAAKGGGGHGAKSTHVSNPDIEPKPLEKQEVEAANAEQVQPLCTTQSQSQREEREESKKVPPVATLPAPQGGGDQAKPKRKPKVPGETVACPDWLDAAAWAAWNEHRRGLKAPWTALAANLSIKALERFREQGDDPVAVIEQSIVAGWPGLWPIKNRQPAPQPKFRNGFAQALHEMGKVRGFTDAADADDDEPLPVNRFLEGPFRAH